MRHLDAFGTEIRKGDLIVYPGRQGSHLYVTKARVLALETAEIQGIEQPVIAVWRLEENARAPHYDRPPVPAVRHDDARISRLDLVTVLPTGGVA